MMESNSESHCDRSRSEHYEYLGGETLGVLNEEYIVILKLSN